MRTQILILSVVCCLVLAACRHNPATPAKSAAPGTTPLMAAAARGDAQSVAKLLRDGARVNEVDIDGYTALHRASHCGDIQVVKSLIAAGADINAVTKHNVTPLMISIDMMCPNSDVTMALILAGADVNVADSNGDTAIVIASTESSFDVMRELLKRGANPNAQGIGGETALHYAAMNSLLDRIELLLQYGARIDVRNSSGKTPLEIAGPEARKLFEGKPGASAGTSLGKCPVIKGPFQFGPDEFYKGAPVIKFLIREDGTVSEVRLIRSSGIADIDKKLLETYSSWQFNKQTGRPAIESQVAAVIDW